MIRLLKNQLDATLVAALLTAVAVQLLANPFTQSILEASERVYWTDSATKKIQRANLDGSNVEDVVIGLGAPIGIAVDSTNGKIYWIDNGTKKIQRSNVDGTNIQDLIVSGLLGPQGIAVDATGGKIYWTDAGADRIERANLDGSSPENLVTSGLEGPQGIALDAASGKMYWTDWDKIQRANLDGSNVENLVTGLAGLIGLSLDLSAGKMYWVDAVLQRISRANLNGTSVESLVGTGLIGPQYIAVGGGKMYWADLITDRIQRANLDGSGTQNIVTGLTNPTGVALELGPSVPAGQLIVNPGVYTGQWFIPGVTATLSGAQTVAIGPGSYNVVIGAPGSPSSFQINIAANGMVTVLNGASAIGGLGTLTFNTASLAVNPAAYSGQWHLGNGVTTTGSGSRTLTLVPAVNYRAIVGGPGSPGGFDFSFAADTTVTVFNGASAVGGLGTLTFNTASLAVNPAAYAGSWLIGNGVTTPAVGAQTVTLVPAVNYRLVVGTVGSPGGFDFSFAGNTTVTVLNGVSAGGGSGTLTFNTVTINADVGTFSGSWDIQGVIQTTGMKLVKVVPNVTYRFRLLTSGFPQQDFSVSSPCAVVPSQFSLGGFPITITCGPPTAEAGPDQTVNEGALVTLDGSGSSASQGGSLTFTWTQLTGAAVSLNLANPIRPTFTAPFVAVGGDVLTFRLIVTEGSRSSEPDVVNIHVTNVNNRPVADAGPDQTVDEGSPVMLNGSNSYDPDAEPLSFSWIQTTGTPVSLLGANTANPEFYAPTVGPAGVTLTFQITVSDGIDTATDSVNVLVENVNHRPVANAGPDQTRDEGSNVTLNGAASNDPDGDVIGFTWTQIAGPAVALSDPSSSTPSFTAPLVNPGGATLTFRLSVSDGLLSSDPDDVSIRIANVNDPPACGLAQPTVPTLWPPNHKLVTVGINNVSDPNNDQMAITITGVTQDEPVNGLGDGDSSPDAVLQGDKVLLRVERAGNGNGRVYRVGFSANDGQGGVCTGSVNVSVPKSMQPGNNAVDDGQNYNSTLP